MQNAKLDIYHTHVTIPLAGPGNTDRGELSRTLPTPFFLRLDTYQKNFEPNYLQAEFIFGKSE